MHSCNLYEALRSSNTEGCMLYYKPTIQMGRMSPEKSISLQRLSSEGKSRNKNVEITYEK